MTTDQKALLEGFCTLQAGRGISLRWGSPQPPPKSRRRTGLQDGDQPVVSAPRANLTSWYVRAANCPKAVFLYMLAIKQNDRLHLKLSPSAHVLLIVEGFGFKPYAGGVCLLDAQAALCPARGWRLTRYESGRGCGLSAAAEELTARRHDYGCTVLILDSGAAAP